MLKKTMQQNWWKLCKILKIKNATQLLWIIQILSLQQFWRKQYYVTKKSQLSVESFLKSENLSSSRKENSVIYFCLLCFIGCLLSTHYISYWKYRYVYTDILRAISYLSSCIIYILFLSFFLFLLPFIVCLLYFFFYLPSNIVFIFSTLSLSVIFYLFYFIFFRYLI